MPFGSDTLAPLYLRFGVKVGLACVLAYAVSYWISSPYPTWAVISSIIAMQLNVAESLHAGWMRLTGTMLGAAAGVALLLFIPSTPLWIGGAVFAVTTLCGFFTRYSNRFNPVSIAAVVVLMAGALYSKSGYEEAVTFGLMRVAEIAIGVGAAFFVSLVLWPVRLMDTLRADLSMQFLECSRLLDSLINAFLNRQQQLPYSLLDSIESKVWENHERLSKTRKHESLFHHAEHRLMGIQVTALDRATESLRALMEALNDYDEEGRDPLMGEELRLLADAIMATMRHLGGDNPAAPAPDLVRRLTSGVDRTEARLAELRRAGATREFNLHKILQLFSFYQTLRVLAESMLIALDRLQNHTARTRKEARA